MSVSALDPHPPGSPAANGGGHGGRPAGGPPRPTGGPPRPGDGPAADPGELAGGAHGPGTVFARAVADSGDDSADVTVELPVSLPLTFPFFADRPRYTVRHLLRTQDMDGPAIPYLNEPPAAGDGARAGTSYADTPEAAYRASLSQLSLTEVSVSAPLPAGLLSEPELLASFVERRVVVRLCTVENEVLLRGSADGRLPGLLALPGLRRQRGRGELVNDLARAAALVEDTGGSCDAMVVHPDVYWSLVASGALGRFNAAGVRVSRTRMIERTTALLGDFRAAATLIDPRRSRLRLVRGRGPELVEAAVRIGLAVHLPQHFLLLTLH